MRVDEAIAVGVMSGEEPTSRTDQSIVGGKMARPTSFGSGEWNSSQQYAFLSIWTVGGCSSGGGSGPIGRFLVAVLFFAFFWGGGALASGFKTGIRFRDDRRRIMVGDDDNDDDADEDDDDDTSQHKGNGTQFRARRPRMPTPVAPTPAKPERNQNEGKE
jgi:hypothetical protein